MRWLTQYKVQLVYLDTVRRIFYINDYQSEVCVDKWYKTTCSFTPL